MRAILFTSLLAAALCVSCSTPPSVKVIDDQTDPVRAVHQLELLDARGEIFLVYLNPEASRKSDRISRYERYSSLRWVLENWGSPDERYSSKGVDYLIYTKRSRNAPRYQVQDLSEERPTKLGYRSGRLVYVETYFGKKKMFGETNPYVFPR